MVDLLALAERCEKATRPDRELDALIHCAIKGWEFSQLVGEFFGTTKNGERFTVGIPERSAHDTAPTHHKMRSDSLAPRYTASLDAAMTLVPEGWIWNVSSTGQAWLDKGDHDLFYGDAATPALALCAAALRARHAIESAA